MWSKQVAPNGANICYGILSCYKQVAPTELMIDKFFKRLNCYAFFGELVSTVLLYVTEAPQHFFFIFLKGFCLACFGRRRQGKNEFLDAFVQLFCFFGL